ncbi:hypothetical protein C0Q70_06432 [Pomacea canaliculata]|uniref:Vesicle-associated membrane protein 7 n=1 Tax=Pomacea canaliculata TaxID=400727 RepID=A0A2T7PP15_POMCA|nr:hypothetical protein C0Q70_06432 [Pomacea canaliculata]
MPILFSVIARGTTVLAKYASCAGNFTEVTEQILAKIPQNENSKLTYSHGRFQSQYGMRAQTALPYAMNSEFSRIMATQMRLASDEKPDQLSKVQDEVDELKGIMVRNIDQIAERGERLELLVDKTEDLSAHSVTFKKTSRGLARSLWWKNIKITVIIVIVVIVLIYFIVSAACGGLDWPCTHK